MKWIVIILVLIVGGASYVLLLRDEEKKISSKQEIGHPITLESNTTLSLGSGTIASRQYPIVVHNKCTDKWAVIDLGINCAATRGQVGTH